MAGRRKKRSQETPELDITTFLNLMVVLIPFLLLSAVFSRITIMELSVPTAAGAGAVTKPNFNIEVIVRSNGFELANGSQVVAAVPKVNNEYDLNKLSQMLISLKNDYPEKEDATVLVEPRVEYNYLIQIMDAVRSAEVKVPGEAQLQKLVLFPTISIGDAP